MKFQRFIIVTGFMLTASVVFSQDLLYEEDTPILRRKEASLGFNFHTSGMGVTFRRGVHLTGKIKRMQEIEFVTLKHPKEHKTKTNEDSNPYVFGKLNSVMVLRVGMGLQHVLYRKGDRTGIEIRFNYSFGLSLGIAKPVYLYIADSPGEKSDSIPPQRYDPVRHTATNIYGKAEFSYGLDELSFYPGGFAKAGFSFEFGRSDRSLRSLETGVVFDLYPKTIPIMAYSKNNPYYFNLYLAFFFGGKW